MAAFNCVPDEECASPRNTKSTCTEPHSAEQKIRKQTNIYMLLAWAAQTFLRVSMWSFQRRCVILCFQQSCHSPEAGLVFACTETLHCKQIWSRAKQMQVRDSRMLRLTATPHRSAHSCLEIQRQHPDMQRKRVLTVPAAYTDLGLAQIHTCVVESLEIDGSLRKTHKNA